MNRRSVKYIFLATAAIGCLWADACAVEWGPDHIIVKPLAPPSEGNVDIDNPIEGWVPPPGATVVSTFGDYVMYDIDGDGIPDIAYNTRTHRAYKIRGKANQTGGPGSAPIEVQGAQVHGVGTQQPSHGVSPVPHNPCGMDTLVVDGVEYLIDSPCYAFPAPPFAAAEPFLAAYGIDGEYSPSDMAQPAVPHLSYDAGMYDAVVVFAWRDDFQPVPPDPKPFGLEGEFYMLMPENPDGHVAYQVGIHGHRVNVARYLTWMGVYSAYAQDLTGNEWILTIDRDQAMAVVELNGAQIDAFDIEHAYRYP